MARIAGIDLPRDKKVEYALPYIFGIGRNNAKRILAETGVSPDTRVRDLRDAEVARLRQVIERDVKVEGALSEDVSAAASGNLMHRHFCPACGTPVFTQTEARRQYLGVRAGTLDDPELGKPQMAIWVGSAPSWAALEDGIPHEPKQAPPPKPKG